jgi:DNA-binding CsgD family transcriptional regulator
MKDYRVEVKVKNNYLFNLMQSYGLSNAAELSRASGLTQTTIGKVLNLKVPAFTKKGETSATAQALCDFFTCSVYDLFPPQHVDDPLQINSGAIEANMTELVSSNLLAGGTDPLQILSDGDATDLLAAAVGKLTNREKIIVDARFGLDGAGGKTLAQIGKELDISSDRVRQIEQKALRKLRTYSTASLAYAHSDKAGEDREEIIIQNAMAIAKSAAKADAKQKREAQEWIALREKQKQAEKEKENADTKRAERHSQEQDPYNGRDGRND